MDIDEEVYCGFCTVNCGEYTSNSARYVKVYNVEALAVCSYKISTIGIAYPDDRSNATIVLRITYGTLF